MIDFSTKYYLDYRNKIEQYKDLILAENFDDQTSLKIDWNTGNGGTGSVVYSFKKMPRKDFLGRKDGVKKAYTNSLVESFFQDERILAFSKITIPAGQSVDEHIDTCYWPKEFFRIHIPLEDTEAVFYYGDEEVQWKFGEVYFFDVRHIKHGAKNKSGKDFSLLIVDICVEDVQTENIISNTNCDIILDEIKNQDFDLSITHD